MCHEMCHEVCHALAAMPLPAKERWHFNLLVARVTITLRALNPSYSSQPVRLLNAIRQGALWFGRHSLSGEADQ